VSAASAARTRRPAGPRRPLHIVDDPDALATVLEDAAHVPGGHASGLVHIETETDVAEVLALRRPVLAIGAQSSLTGGATPRGELVLCTSKLQAIGVGDTKVSVGAGVTLEALQARLSSSDRLYPPVPTYTGATVGGVVATNAAGPATFKYATTREWVEGLTVVLASGDVLDLRRGEVRAHPDGYFEIHAAAGAVRVPIVPLQRPDVPKCSAGYALAREMDLVDLFVGAEGTLGIVTAATLRVLDHPPTQCLAFVAVEREEQAIGFAAALRAATLAARRDRDPRGLDVSAIEHADRRAIELLREDGLAREADVRLDEAAAVLFVVLDLPSGTSEAAARAMVEDALEPGAPDTPIGRFCRMAAREGLLDCTELVLPGDAARRQQLLALREGVPQAVNRRIALAQQRISPALTKLAGDFVVPFEAFGAMDAACRAACAHRDLDLAVWGHISDGNVHPNIIPRREADLALGREALLEAGRAVIALGGSPLAEHGVGRSEIKQQFLELLHGASGVAAMHAVKQAFDPHHLLAPGVLLR
jgi:D-lactate dehydrogenase (cytochrome)